MKMRFWIVAFLAAANLVSAEPLLTSDQWEGKKPTSPEILISQGEVAFAAILKGSRLKIVQRDSKGAETVLLETELKTGKDSKLGGMAIWKDRIVCSLTKEETLIFISIPQKKILSQQSLPDFPSPRGLAFDATGKLWAVSGNTLAELQFTDDGHFNPIHHRGDFDHPQHLLFGKNGHLFISEAGEKPQVQELDVNLKTIQTTMLPQGKTCSQLIGAGNGSVTALLNDGQQLVLR